MSWRNSEEAFAAFAGTAVMVVGSTTDKNIAAAVAAVDTYYYGNDDSPVMDPSRDDSEKAHAQTIVKPTREIGRAHV